ncbi:RelA/SpoT domain-containing protein [Bradyrhizobium elkanii]|uniref:GTP pyrophosphokinase n=1 Tax=Bradyrhizobium elkanii TaxID=29448 RepID=UPI002711EEE0|nr:RelA/SpoT domain-containing protein [Bradyrhizobium elkanii]WLA38541.1 RelA/SpoT domain-containing protein [Bradyrhizobium elkanii]
MTASEPWENEFKAYYVEHSRHWVRALKYFRSLIELRLSSEFEEVVEVVGRVKTVESCVEKIVRRRYLTGISPEEHLEQIYKRLTDFVGIRIVCFFEEDVAQVAAILRQEFYVIAETNKIEELEESEAMFGYRAHHLDLSLEQSKSDQPGFKLFGSISFEVQIRTIVQDAWTTLQNKLAYKKAITKMARRKLAALAAVFESIDHDFVELRDQISTDPLAPISTEHQSPPLQSDIGDESELYSRVLSVIAGPISPAMWQRLMLDLDHLYPEWSVRVILAAIEEQLVRISSYFEQNPNINLKPILKIRLLLYASNPVRFKPMVPISDRQVFDAWSAQERGVQDAKKKALRGQG